MDNTHQDDSADRGHVSLSHYNIFRLKAVENPAKNMQ